MHAKYNSLFNTGDTEEKDFVKLRGYIKFYDNKYIEFKIYILFLNKYTLTLSELR